MTESSPQTEIFSGRLKAARAKRDLSQEGLAKLANLQASAISHFETGTRKPSFDNLRRLADALEVTTDFVLVSHSTIPPARWRIHDRNYLHPRACLTEWQHNQKPRFSWRISIQD